ncbi:MAG: VCBS domain-containing protein, partial [Gammaproteobacteria bacterium]|nr:VCBS domain-containing protein [Gammaproteobacteria bacterium]
VHSADGTAQTITVTIQGQDDAAKFSSVQSYSDDIYTPIGVSLMDAGPKEFLYISEVLLANQLPRNYATAEVAITTSGGIGLRSPDGSISVTYHSTGGVATVPLMELQAWHNKGAGYEVVLVDHPGGEVQIYAHDQGNPAQLSGFNTYVTGISNPSQAALGFTPSMHDAAASGGAAVQGYAVMPPAIAPLEFDSGHVLEDNGQHVFGFSEVQDADAGHSAMQSQTVTVSIQGTNDDPVLAAQTQAVTVDGTQLSGKMIATDVLDQDISVGGEGTDHHQGALTADDLTSIEHLTSSVDGGAVNLNGLSIVDATSATTISGAAFSAEAGGDTGYTADFVSVSHSPVADYLQFVDTSTAAATLGDQYGTTSFAVHDYLTAAGIDSLTPMPDDSNLPPTDVLLDLQHAAELDEHSAANEQSIDPADGFASMDSSDIDDTQQHHTNI